MNVEGGEETTVGHDEILGHEEGEEDSSKNHRTGETGEEDSSKNHRTGETNDARGIKEEKYFEVERRGAKDDETGTRKLADPRVPTESERKEHEMTHIPYRNWCPHFVRGRGKDMDHP